MYIDYKIKYRLYFDGRMLMLILSDLLAPGYLVFRFAVWPSQ